MNGRCTWEQIKSNPWPMYRCLHCRTVIELRNLAETIEAVAARLPGCDELRRQNDATRTECRKSSDDCLRLAKIGAEKLGITWGNARHWPRVLATWVKAGMPERTPEEQAVCLAKCEVCGHYGPPVDAEGWPSVCLRGCSGPRREKRLSLLVLWRMATGRCKAGMW